MSTHTITISLTEAAQRAAVLAGQHARREQTFQVCAVDLPALLALGANVDADGKMRHSATGADHPGPEGSGTYNGRYTLELDERPRDGAHAISLVQAALDARRQAAEAKAAAEAAEKAERAAEQAIEAARLTAALADAPLSAADLRTTAATLEEYVRRGVAYAPRDGEVALDARGHEGSYGVRLPALDARVRLLAAEELARRATTRQAAAELAERRLRTLAGIVREHGDDAARGRLDLGMSGAPGPLGPLGMLPEEEAIQIATDVRLPVTLAGSEGRPLAPEALREYVPLEGADVRECCVVDDDGEYDHAVDPSYLTEAPDALTADEWRGVQATRRALKGAGLPEGKLRRHKGECDHRGCPAWPVSRLGLVVELDLGDGLVVSREYGV